MKSGISLVSCLMAALLVACTPPNASVERRVAAAERRVASAEAEIKKFKAELQSIRATQNVDSILEKMERTAFLTPGDEGYSVVRSDLGVLTIALENVEPYANGSRVTFSIGNPLSSAINGFSAKIEWGKVDERGLAVEETVRSKKVTLSQPLRAGSWNYSAFVLDGVPPEQLGFVRVSELHHTGIQLSR